MCVTWCKIADPLVGQWEKSASPEPTEFIVCCEVEPSMAAVNVRKDWFLPCLLKALYHLKNSCHVFLVT